MEKRRGAIALVLVLLLARLAHATGGRATDQPLIVLTEAGRQDAEDAAFFSSVRALAAEIGIGVGTQEVPSFLEVRDALLAKARQESKPFLVSWIVREPNARTIHLFDPWKNQLRTRTIAASASPPANAETLALILRAELLAYLREPPVPAVPPPVPVAPLPPPSPVPPTPPRSDPRWAVAASYAAGTFLRGQALQHGARVGLWHRSERLRLGAHYALWLGQQVRADDVGLTVGRHALELHAGYATEELGRLRLVPEVFVSGELWTRHTSFATPPLSPQADDRRVAWALGVRGRAELRISPSLALFLAVATQALLNPHDLQIARGTTSTTIARPAPVRVIGEIGLHWLFF